MNFICYLTLLWTMPCWWRCFRSLFFRCNWVGNSLWCYYCRSSRTRCHCGERLLIRGCRSGRRYHNIWNAVWRGLWFNYFGNWNEKNNIKLNCRQCDTAREKNFQFCYKIFLEKQIGNLRWFSSGKFEYFKMQLQSKRTLEIWIVFAKELIGFRKY